VKHELAPAVTPINPTFSATTIDITPTAGGRGTRVRVDGKGFLPGERVKVLVHTTEVDRVEANGSGGFSTTIVIPAGTMAIGGQTTIAAFGEQSARSQHEAFTLTDG
jgi:hypothetical protein